MSARDIRTVIREAAIINMLDRDPELGEVWNDRVKTELWCLREGIDTENSPEIWDITFGAWPTATVINWVLDDGDSSRHEQAARLLCTMRELL